MEKKAMSRRDFMIKSTVGVAAVAGAGVLSACSSTTSATSTNASATTTTDTSGELACNDTGKSGYWNENGLWIPRWLVPPDPYTTWDEELDCDVLVIGLGVAGLCATRAALEENVTVIAVEQSESYNCRAAQFGNVNSKYQNDYDVVFTEDNKIDMINKEMLANAYRPDPKIWRYFLDHSGEAFEWHVSANPDIIMLNPNLTPTESGIDGSTVPTSGMGAASTDGKMYMTCYNNPKNPEYDYSQELYPMYPTVICFRPDQTALNDKIMAIIDADDDATVRFKTWARQLITDVSGAVVGAFVEDIDGKVTKINASAVVDSCGDYASNAEMRSYYAHDTFEFTSWVWPSTDANGDPSNMGMGLKLAAWAGAKPDFSAPSTMTHSFGGSLGCDPFLLVNRRGERFVNEDVPGHLWSQRALRTPGKVMFQVFDSNYPNQVHTMPTGHANYWKIDADEEQQPWGNYIEHIGWRTPDEVTANSTAVCDTLDELAEKLDIDATTFKATVARYNELAAAGKDTDFGKRADRLYPIDTPPYYGTKLDGAFAFCMPFGVLCDSEAHALNEDYELVTGLYVAGNTMGCRFSADYPTTMMGVSHGMAMTYGRLAGMNAAKGV